MNGRNPLLRAGVIVAASGALLTLNGPASSAAIADYQGAGQRGAGSEIAAHEGVHGTPTTTRFAAAGQTLGHDVSGHQGAVNWKSAKGAGGKFVYVKATEGTGYTSPQFAQQYNGSHGAGMVRGAYHFARPGSSGGSTQAKYFVDNGGGWSNDGRTLPGALDLEYAPNGDSCYGLSPSAMTAWIKDFSDTYKSRTGRAPAIYTSTNWWKQCTGNTSSFGATNPLWLARYSSEIGELPAGWKTETIWQFATSGELPGDQNYFHGGEDRLRALAAG